MPVAPRPRKMPDDEALNRLRRAARSRDRADAELRAAVIAASEDGGSIRVIAEAGELSTATVRAWVDEHRRDTHDS